MSYQGWARAKQNKKRLTNRRTQPVNEWNSHISPAGMNSGLVSWPLGFIVYRSITKNHRREGVKPTLRLLLDQPVALNTLPSASKEQGKHAPFNPPFLVSVYLIFKQIFKPFYLDELFKFQNRFNYQSVKEIMFKMGERGQNRYFSSSWEVYILRQLPLTSSILTPPLFIIAVLNQ